jgi:hypothetical protein
MFGVLSYHPHPTRSPDRHNKSCSGQCGRAYFILVMQNVLSFEMYLRKMGSLYIGAKAAWDAQRQTPAVYPLNAVPTLPGSQECLESRYPSIIKVCPLPKHHTFV